MSAHLIVKLGAIGDVVMTLAAVKHFKDTVGGEIHWVCGVRVAPLLKLFSFIDRIIAVDDEKIFGSAALRRTRELIRIWKYLAGSRYETCAVLQYDWRYSLLVLPIWARRQIRLSETERSRKLIPGRYQGDEYARILLGKDGLRPTRLPSLGVPENLPPSPLAPTRQKKRIALVPGGARNTLRNDPQRRWPLSHYVDLSISFLSRDYEIILIGGPEDVWACSAFAGLGTIDLIGRLDLIESLSLFETCDLVVSHDTGPFHLATLSSAPVFALFGPVNPLERIPNRPNIRYIWGGEGLACRPCYDGRDFARCSDNRCMKEISPRMVFRVAEEMLNQRSTAQKLQVTLV